MSVPYCGRGLAASRDLPPYRAILVVDAKGFSDVPSAQQPELNVEIHRLLEAAFARADLMDVWQGRRFPQHTGDGFIAGFLPEKLPHLIDPLLGELQAVLQAREVERRAREPRLRLRVSVHVGPLPDEGLANDGVGTPMNDVHRLLNSDEVRQALAASHKAVTFVAAIISHRAFEDAVSGGYTGLHESQFVEVTAHAKRFAEPAYLYVPEPSARAGDRTPAEAAQPSAPPPPIAAAATSVSVGGRGNVVHGGTGNIDASTRTVIVGRLVPTSLHDVLGDLSQDDVERRIGAARWLADQGYIEAVPELARRLKREQDPEALAAVIEALGSTGGDEARQALREFAKSPAAQSQFVKSAIEDALRQARRAGRGLGGR